MDKILSANEAVLIVRDEKLCGEMVHLGLLLTTLFVK